MDTTKVLLFLVGGLILAGGVYYLLRPAAPVADTTGGVGPAAAQAGAGQAQGNAIGAALGGLLGGLIGNEVQSATQQASNASSE